MPTSGGGVTVSGDSIYVNYSGVSNVYEALEIATTAMQSVFNELQDTVQTQLMPTWSGASESEYTQVQTRWNNDMQAMQSLLTQYRGTLDEITVNYSSTDNQLALQWSSLG
jgi:WXG100 family type VII secretion target